MTQIALPDLTKLATGALSYVSPVFNFFKPLLFIILGLFLGYFILETIIDIMTGVKDRELKNKNDEEEEEE